MAEAVLAAVGVGSNLEDPVAQVRSALRDLQALPQSHVVAVSSLYRSPPMGPQDQPDFINAVALLKTGLTPLALLDALQAIEHAHHRVRERHWGPRTLDLDLLTYGIQRIQHARLTVPHPGLAQRAFVVLPLAEIAPDLEIPDLPAPSILLQDFYMADITRVPEPALTP